ncbi:SDR family oxidoreductase [Paenarthrobacter sp. NPDC092416]|uniref:SDR family oxidoreductase n=1 Tax=Paenarthrobacter sp. NPDC092416 TaxID=3364386 RepID=UPI003800D981
MTVLMVGCGDLGTEAGLRLAAQGHRVIGWRRSPEKLPAGIDPVKADLAHELPTIPHDVDSVIIAVTPNSSTPEAYRATYVDGLNNVIDTLKRDAVTPRRILFVSSTAVYGDADGGDVDELTPADADSFSGNILREAEELLARRFIGTETLTTSLRLGGIYGPGRTRLIDQVTTGSALIPDQPRFTNRIHRDDAAAAIVHLVTMPGDPDPVYLGVDTNPAELGDVLRFLANELGCDEPARGHVPATRSGSKRCSSRKLQATGFEFTYPTFVEGYRAVLAGIGTRHP